MGIEPTSSAWEAEVLPLNYTRGVITFTDLRFTADYDKRLGHVMSAHQVRPCVRAGFP
jgi:hypothetical protein